MARVTLGTKIRCGYPYVKCGVGYRSGDGYRVYGKRSSPISRSERKRP